MKTLTSIAILMLMSVPLCSSAAGNDVILHVTSVRQEDAKDWCETGKCHATRFTVEGYRAAKNPNQVIRYVLECVEVRSTETMRLEISCVRVQADEEYSVKLLADAIIFPGEKSNDGTVSGYAIKSQKVENK